MPSISSAAGSKGFASSSSCCCCCCCGGATVSFVGSGYAAGASGSALGASATGRVASGSASSPSYLGNNQYGDQLRLYIYQCGLQIGEKILVGCVRHDGDCRVGGPRVGSVRAADAADALECAECLRTGRVRIADVSAKTVRRECGLSRVSRGWEKGSRIIGGL
jgi:hypothetical protein